MRSEVLLDIAREAGHVKIAMEESKSLLSYLTDEHLASREEPLLTAGMTIRTQKWIIAYKEITFNMRVIEDYVNQVFEYIEKIEDSINKIIDQ